MTSPGLVAGVDVGGSKVMAVVVERDLRVVGRARLATRHGEHGVVDTVVRAVRQACARAGATPQSLSAIGVGVPGLVDSSAGRVSHAVNLGLGDDHADLVVGLEHQLGVPVTIENDVNVAAVGAFVTRVPRPSGDLALLSIGTGLAAGVVLDGRLHRGARGAAGEIGHVPVDPAGAPCSCGQRGCLETVGSGAALSAAWPHRAADGASTVWSAAAAGDAAARAVVDRFAAAVAAAVRLLVLAWDVPSVVLAGGVTEVGEPLLGAVKGALGRAEAASPLLAALELSARVTLLEATSPVAAVGAAVVAADRLGPQPDAAQEVS